MPLLAPKASTPTASAAFLRPRVLVVDDDRTARFMLDQRLSALGWAVETAANGAEAFAMLREDPTRTDVIIADRAMPVMDGLALTRRLKRERETSPIPIIMLTGATEAEDIGSGLEAGVFYYLPKPPVEKVLTSVLATALQEVRRRQTIAAEIGRHRAGFTNLTLARFHLRRPEEVEPVVSLMASMCDQPERIIQGIFELVQNAVEHGVLRFGLEAKSRLLAEGNWTTALAERANDPAYAGGDVEAAMMRRKDGLYVIVKDNGPGFDWRRHLSSDPTRAAAACGRGIARAAAFSFDQIRFNKAGNQVVAVLASKRRVVW